MMNVKLQNTIGYSSDLVDRSSNIQTIMDSKKFKPPIKLVDENTFVGIEVEVERVFRTAHVLSYLPDCYVWRNIEDGSLRNNGREFVSIPLKGNSILFALDFLKEVLTKEKTCVGHEFSDRTSVHVHVNVRDITPEQVKSLILTYLVVEPLLYAYVGGDRAKNIFCVPLTEATLTSRLNDIMQSNNRDSFRNSIGEWYKYTGFNLLPILEYGTIEFRHMRGTIDPKILGIWINFLLSIKNYAVKYPFEKIKDFIFNLNTSSEYHNFMHEVFGELLNELPRIDYSEILEPTTTFVKDVFTYHTINIRDEFNKLPYKEEKDKVLSYPFFQAAKNAGIIHFVDIKAKIRELEKLIKSKEKVLAQYQDHVKMIKKSKLTPAKQAEESEYSLFEIKRAEDAITKYKNIIKSYSDGYLDESVPEHNEEGTTLTSFMQDWEEINNRFAARPALRGARTITAEIPSARTWAPWPNPATNPVEPPDNDF